jgi:hypothetical protein
VDPDLLLSLVELAQFGSDVDSLENLSDNHITEWLRPYRDTKADKKSLTCVDTLVAKGLHIRMPDKNIAQRIMTLFADYSTLLRSNGILWVVKEKPKVAARHMVEAMRPRPLQKRLQEDLLKRVGHGIGV